MNELTNKQHSTPSTTKKGSEINFRQTKYSPFTEALEELEWKHFDHRRHLHRCVFIFRCLHKIIDFNFRQKNDIHHFIIPASARICTFLLPKQTGQSKQSHTKQLSILTFYVIKYRKLNLLGFLKRNLNACLNFIIFYLYRIFLRLSSIALHAFYVVITTLCEIAPCINIIIIIIIIR